MEENNAQGPSEAGGRRPTKRSRPAAEVPEDVRIANNNKSQNNRDINAANNLESEKTLELIVEDMKVEWEALVRIAKLCGLTDLEINCTMMIEIVTVSTRTSEKLVVLVRQIKKMTDMRKSLEDKILERLGSFNCGKHEQGSINTLLNLSFLTEDEQKTLRCLEHNVNVSAQQSVVSAHQSVQNGCLLQQIMKILLKLVKAEVLRTSDTPKEPETEQQPIDDDHSAAFDVADPPEGNAMVDDDQQLPVDYEPVIDSVHQGTGIAIDEISLEL